MRCDACDDNDWGGLQQNFELEMPNFRDFDVFVAFGNSDKVCN